LKKGVDDAGLCLYAISTMKNTKNTTSYKVGDTILGNDVYRFGGSTWMYIYEVLAVENKPRFGKPDQLLTVKITTTEGAIVDKQTKRWSGQIF
jgi:hypothetical protein